VLQSIKIVHNAQKWLGELLVSDLVLNVVSFNRFSRSVESVSYSMYGEREAFIMFDQFCSLGSLVRGRSSDTEILVKESTGVFNL
jgi:hypothetical protein